MVNRRLTHPRTCTGFRSADVCSPRAAWQWWEAQLSALAGVGRGELFQAVLDPFSYPDVSLVASLPLGDLHGRSGLRREPTNTLSLLSDDELLATINRDLRAIYSDIIRQPLPTQLAAVLKRLETRALTAEAQSPRVQQPAA